MRDMVEKIVQRALERHRFVRLGTVSKIDNDYAWVDGKRMRYPADLDPALGRGNWVVYSNGRTKVILARIQLAT